MGMDYGHGSSGDTGQEGWRRIGAKAEVWDIHCAYKDRAAVVLKGE